MSNIDSAAATAFRARLTGTFHGILQWQQLDALWDRIKRGQWFFYQTGESLPERPLTGAALAERVDALNTLLRHDHDHDYCGIVYVDDVEQPTLVKVYDPNNLGSSCSHDAAPVLPLWILSTAQPAPVESHVAAPANRRRWWRLFSD
jgi:hypothetical protein